MKKILLSLALVMPFFMFANYAQKRKEFETKLFNAQIKVIPNFEQFEPYKKFIGPFLDEAEETLDLAKYFKADPNNQNISKYFDYLTVMNIKIFWTLRKHNDMGFYRVDNYDNKFKMLAITLKNEATLSIDIFQEWLKTLDLLAKANKEYIQLLSF